MPGGRKRARQGERSLGVHRHQAARLRENLESGATVEEFLEWFEGAEEWKVRAALQHVADSLRASVPAGNLENPV